MFQGAKVIDIDELNVLAWMTYSFNELFCET